MGQGDHKSRQVSSANIRLTKVQELCIFAHPTTATALRHSR